MSSFGVRRNLAISAGILIASAAFAGPQLASASTNGKSCITAAGTKVQGAALCRGLQFYKGKTITYVAPTGAGSPYDVASRAITKEMESYLGASINVVDIATGQSIPGQDAIAAAQPNGLTIGFFNIGTDYYDVLTGQSGPSFNLRNSAFLGGPTPNLQLIATQASSQYPTFTSVLQATPANPAKFLGIAGTSTALSVLLFKAFGINANYITGYPSGNAMITGFQRDDGNLMAASTGELQSEIVGGTARILATITTTDRLPRGSANYSILKSVPTIPELLVKYPPKTPTEKKAASYAEILNAMPDIVLSAPSATPSFLISALDAAVKFAIQSNYYKEQIRVVGNALGYLSPTADKTEYETDLKLAPRMEALLK